MCKFFSMVSKGDGEPIYCDWNIRKQVLEGKIQMESPDSHTSIATHFGYKGEKEDSLNKYEYNPLTKVFTVDQINTTDDKCLIEEWVRNLDFKTIVPHLSLGVIKNPLETKAQKVSNNDLILLKEWASVGASVWDSVCSSVWASIGAYTISFFTIDQCKYVKHEKGVNPFQSCIDLYKRGLVPSFDGKIWRLHAGKKADIVWQGTIDDLNKQLTKKRRIKNEN